MSRLNRAAREEAASVDNNSPRSRSRVLPVIPVRDAVYFPGMLFPLFIGREKSIRALDYALQHNRLVLLIAQKDISVEDPDAPDIYSVGTVAEVVQVLRVPDGTVRVTLEGLERARVTRFLNTEPFFKVRAKCMVCRGSLGTALEALMRSVTGLFEQLVQNQIAQNNRPIPPELLINIAGIEDPGQLADAIVPHLSVRMEVKQEMLETVDPGQRLEKLNSILARELEILDVQQDIRSRVEKEMGDNQREFILREQLKAIQAELGEQDARLGEFEEYEEKIARAGMPAEVEARALKELGRLERMPYAAPEGVVIRNYLDWLVELPWSRRSEDCLDVDQAARILDEDHYGLSQVKQRIIEFLAVRQLAGNLKGPILCFVGPPGVGKTSIGKSIARAMGRRFFRASLGGVRDEAEIRGHRRTYVGALPGRIIQGIKQAGTRNPVFMLDEIDKLGTDFRGDPSSALLEALDPEQNDSFSDHYLEVPFDLQDVMFITTANVLETIPPALRDRMEVIRFSGYTEDEKMEIARRFLIPKQISENGLAGRLVAFSEPAIRKTIREYTREAGVRSLEREIASICRKVAVSVAKGESKRVRVRDRDLKAYLGTPRFRYGRAGERDEVGAAAGLVYTEFGGDVVSVEVALMRGEKGTLTMTGQLGDIMKESGMAALTYVRSRAQRLGVDENFYANTELHVHVPEGAVPKDGPSAGITLAAAMASALTSRPVRKDVAMTGEITLRGRVLPVGGIKEKVLAAHRAGITTVILPAENRKDLDDIPENVSREIEFVFVEHADEVLSAALKPPGSGAESQSDDSAMAIASARRITPE